MQVHRLSVTGRQNERCALSVAWADGAKDIGRGGALIGRRREPGAAPRPTAGDLVLLTDASLVSKPDFYITGLVLLTDARLVSKPDFYITGIDAFLLRDGLQTGRETFLKSSIAPSACA
jgi:hypothetical protein